MEPVTLRISKDSKICADIGIHVRLVKDPWYTVYLGLMRNIIFGTSIGFQIPLLNSWMYFSSCDFKIGVYSPNQAFIPEIRVIFHTRIPHQEVGLLNVA